MFGNRSRGGRRAGGTTRRQFVGGLGAVGAGTLATGTATIAADAAGELVAFQYFHESWSTIVDDIPRVADRGYDVLWIPPVEECRFSLSTQHGRNDPPPGYQPVDFRSFDGGYGSAEELRTLVDTAHGHGLEVYVDTVLNHMAELDFEAFPRFGSEHFHHDVGSIDDWNDEHQVEHGNLLKLKDLAQLDDDPGVSADEASYVRGELYEYVRKLAEFGFDGYRYDAVKHVEETFWRDYANPWADEFGMQRVGEVFTGSVDYALGYVDTGMNAFDYPLFWTLRDVFDYGDMRKLEGAGVKAVDPWHAWPFAENHDEHGPTQYKLAYAHVLTSEGTPVVYNLYPDWILDDDDVNNMVWVRKNLSGGETYWRHTDENLAIYERYGNLLVGLNNSDAWQGAWVPTSWTDAALNDYAGNAEDVTVDGDGWVEVWVPPESWVFYAPY